ncbi:MAG: hypothetical protein AB9907_00685 [Flexilinea sp.]
MCTQRPAEIDIPGILRRLEARNYTGASRELHRRNSIGNLYCIDCPAENMCERHCYRCSFTAAVLPANPS